MSIPNFSEFFSNCKKYLVIFLVNKTYYNNQSKCNFPTFKVRDDLLDGLIDTNAEDDSL